MTEFDFEKMLSASERNVARHEEVQRRAADLVGRVQSPDGRVTVESTGQDSLSKLELDPRAMRMSSAELAEVIMATAREAKNDLQRQGDALRNELFGADGDPMEAVPDQENIQATIEDMKAVFNGTLEDTSRLLDQIRKEFRL
jgi:DNA-binding protein YbaB